MKQSLFLFFIILSFSAISQSRSGLISGPSAGNIELRNATIWADVSPSVTSVAVTYKKVLGEKTERTIKYTGPLGKEFNPVKIELNGLEMNTKYSYQLILNGKGIQLNYPTGFTTKDLWQYRKPAPDFNFLAGSCAYFNEPLYDRPGKPYGMDSSIFLTIGNTPAAFNLWLGDSWYTREVDYYTVWGLQYRVSHDKGLPVLQKLLAAMPQYHIWDDHDYGPNNAGKSFIYKKESREVFQAYTTNPSYGENNQGIYSKLSYSDVDIFLTDNRFFRSERKMIDSVDGKPNSAKTYFGEGQLDWLKNSLLYSTATFKIIATGGQVLNPISTSEAMRFYSHEYNELLNFLEVHKIPGVVFFTGDRHHSEVIKKERKNLYTLYDVTISPLTASIGIARGAEINNPARVAGTLVEAQNFGNISITGKPNERVLKVNFTGINGNIITEWSINEKDLK